MSLFQASTCFEHMCSSQGGQNCIIQPGIITPIGGRPVHGMATYRCDDTRDCIIQFCPPDDEYMCSKHVQTWNKLIIKFSASSWLILINKQNTLLCFHCDYGYTPAPDDNYTYIGCLVVYLYADCGWPNAAETCSWVWISGIKCIVRRLITGAHM